LIKECNKANQIANITSEDEKLKLAIQKCKNFDKFNNIDEVRKNIIYLYIYYDNLGYTKITEEPIYDIISLLSSVGGKNLMISLAKYKS
jgi:hypothetical protein